MRYICLAFTFNKLHLGGETGGFTCMCHILTINQNLMQHEPEFWAA